jgi:RNA-binding protein
MSEMTNALLRELKARAQLLKPTLKVGKDGLSPQFVAEVDQTLKHLELIKVKFDSFKEERKELAKELAGKTNSHVVMQVGHVVVLFRPKPRGPEAVTDETAE